MRLSLLVNTDGDGDGGPGLLLVKKIFIQTLYKIGYLQLVDFSYYQRQREW